MSEDSIRSWLDDYFQGKLEVKRARPNAEDLDVKTIKALSDTVRLARRNFTSEAFTEGYDTAVLFYSSAGEEDSKLIAPIFNRCASKFKEFKIGSVKIASYDMHMSVPPDKMDFVKETPLIVFLPAYNKKEPFKRYLGNANTGDIMKYIQKNADIEFTIPDVNLMDMVEEAKKKKQKEKDQMEELERIAMGRNDL